jgi:hypothetical protein
MRVRSMEKIGIWDIGMRPPPADDGRQMILAW